MNEKINELLQNKTFLLVPITLEKTLLVTYGLFA